MEEVRPSYPMNLWPESVASNQQHSKIPENFDKYLHEDELERVGTGFYWRVQGVMRWERSRVEMNVEKEKEPQEKEQFSCLLHVAGSHG